MFKKTLSLAVITCFFLTTLGPIPKASAEGGSAFGGNLPAPGTMVDLSPAYVPVIVKGLRVHPENPILFDFIVDTGDDASLRGALATKQSQEYLKQESLKLIKYFLASLTIPENDLWVNLSPYEKNRIIPGQLGRTEMGRDMLAEDYMLKQITASLINPEKNLGKEFWERIYAQAREQYGTNEVPVNTFNKVWIVADKAKVYVHANTAFVVASHLKVMMEEDYLALEKHQRQPGGSSDRQNCRQAGCQANERMNAKAPEGNNPNAAPANMIASRIIKQIILPELEKEVNTGKNFANLRQIFHSMILAAWYKKNLKEALLNQVYSNKAKINGIERVGTKVLIPDTRHSSQSQQDLSPEQIYQQYVQAYKKGVFNYIKEDIQNGQTVPRKYFSGGETFEGGLQKLAVTTDPRDNDAQRFKVDGAMIDIKFKASDAAMAVPTPASPDVKTIKVLFADAPAGKEATISEIQRALQPVQDAHPGVSIEVLQSTGKGPQALKEIIEREKPAIVYVRSETTAFGTKGEDEFDYKEFIDEASANGVRIIVRMGTGYDNIDAQYAGEKGITVIRTHGNADSVADLTVYFMSLLGIAGNHFKGTPGNSLKEYMRLVNNSGKWSRDVSQTNKYYVSEHIRHYLLGPGQVPRVHGRVVIGLLGFGPISQAVARQLQEINKNLVNKFKVLAATRSFDSKDPDSLALARSLDVVPVSRAELLREANIISIHLPGGEGLGITAREMANSNVQAVINTSREDLFPYAVAEGFLLKGGVLLGDLDITPNIVRLIQNDHSLAIIFPHIGASTQSAGEGVEKNTVEASVEIIRRLLGHVSKNALDIRNNVPITPIADAAMASEKGFIEPSVIAQNVDVQAMATSSYLRKNVFLVDGAGNIKMYPVTGAHELPTPVEAGHHLQASLIAVASGIRAFTYDPVDMNLNTWDLNRGKWIQVGATFTPDVTDMATSDDGRTIVMANTISEMPGIREKTSGIIIRDLYAGRSLGEKSIVFEPAWKTAKVAISGDGKMVMVGGPHGVRTYGIIWSSYPIAATDLSISRDGKKAAVMDNEGTMHLLDFEQRKETGHWSQDHMHLVVMSGDMNRAVMEVDGTLIVVDVRTKRRLYTLMGYQHESSNKVAMFPDGQGVIAYVKRDRKVLEWSLSKRVDEAMTGQKDRLWGKEILKPFKKSSNILRSIQAKYPDATIKIIQLGQELGAKNYSGTVPFTIWREGNSSVIRVTFHFTGNDVTFAKAMDQDEQRYLPGQIQKLLSMVSPDQKGHHLIMAVTQEMIGLRFKIRMLPLHSSPSEYVAPRSKDTRPVGDKAQTNGGIDLNTRHMNMDVSGEKIDMQFDQATIAQFRRGDFSGVSPVIITITPIVNVRSLMGFSSP